MARAILSMPFHASRFGLKIVNMLVTFILAFFCYATGQTPKATPSGDAASKSSQSFVGLLRAAMPALVEITPDYGVEPLYGTVEYGVPYASFTVKGTIRQEQNSQTIEGIQVTLKDTSQGGAILASTTTDNQGNYSLSLEAADPYINTWLLRAEDIDAGQNSGNFNSRDSLVTIPYDSLKGGANWFAGSAEAAVDLLLSKNGAVSTGPLSPETRSTMPMSIRQLTSETVELNFTIASPGLARIRTYNSSGEFIAEVHTRDLSQGPHTLAVDISGLSAGTYYFRLDSSGMARVTKAVIAR